MNNLFKLFLSAVKTFIVLDAHCTDKIINKDIFSLVQLVNNNCFNSHSLDCIHETHDHSSGFSVVLHAVIDVMQ